MAEPTPAEEIRAAATRLRCDHRHPVQPPLGSLARPGDCSQCGAPYGHEPVSESLAEPLAAWLESWDGFDIPESAPHADDWEHALRVARAINGSRT